MGHPSFSWSFPLLSKNILEEDGLPKIATLSPITRDDPTPRQCSIGDHLHAYLSPFVSPLTSVMHKNGHCWGGRHKGIVTLVDRIRSWQPTL